ncbi:MAG: hypothetical protein ACRDSE_00135 [Pseudonocardiaceae bacterium]
MACRPGERGVVGPHRGQDRGYLAELRALSAAQAIIAAATATAWGR